MKTKDIRAGELYVSGGSGDTLILVLSTERFERNSFRHRGPGSIQRASELPSGNSATRGVLAVQIVNYMSRFTSMDDEAAGLAEFAASFEAESAVGQRAERENRMVLADGRPAAFAVRVVTPQQIASTYNDFVTLLEAQKRQRDVEREAAVAQGALFDQQIAAIKKALGIAEDDHETLRSSSTSRVSMKPADLLKLIAAIAQ
jgi:hypothetical protein